MNTYQRTLPIRPVAKPVGVRFQRGAFRHRHIGLFAALMVALGVVLAPPPARATPATEKFVQENIDKGYAILNNKSLSDKERRAQFRDFMLGLTDIRRIGMFTLGPYIRGASKDQINKFIDAFKDYAVAVYESRLSKYEGQTLKVVGSIDRKTGPDYDSIVKALVIDPEAPDAPPIQAAFRVRPDMTTGMPIIIDMQVEGVWLAINQRADFTAYLQQHNGSIMDLADHLIQQAKQVQANQPA